MASKKLKTSDEESATAIIHANINDLPEELLLMLFSYLTPQELYCIIRPVCKRWWRMSKIPSLWRNIKVKNDVPLTELRKWFQIAENLNHLELINREDVSVILRDVSAYSSNLETLTLTNCKGSATSPVIPSQDLCKVLNKCKKLTTFNFDGVSILSNRFFQMICKRTTEQICSYSGPVSPLQLYLMSENDEELFDSDN